jgi:hypothetical protein
MALSPQQAQVARFLVTLARSHGLSPQRAQEFAAAAYAESGLNPSIRNKTSGATGLFQLLSSGYVNRANQMGGVTNPRANANAILPSYIAYWRSHPNAVPGQAGAAVERSGEGSSFYAGPLSILRGLGAGASLSSAPAAAPVAPTGQAPSPAGPVGNPRAALATALIAANQASGRNEQPDYSQFAALVAAARQPSVAQAVAAPAQARTRLARGGINELFYDPLGAIKAGQQIAPVGGHSDHVHVALTSLQAQLNAESEARQLGLRVGQEQNADVTRVHVPTSYHYRNFPGSRYREAADVSGDPARMAAFYKWVAKNFR